MIRHLGKMHTVVVASLAESELEIQEASELRNYCSEVIAEVVPSPVRWLQASKRVFSGMPSSVAYFWSSKLYRRIQTLLSAAEFDVIFVHCTFVAQYVIGYQQGHRILDLCDVDSAKWRDYSRYKGIPLSWGYAWEAAKLRNYERRVARHFHQCVVISRGELEEFQRLEVGVPCTIVPNGVDTGYFFYDAANRNESSAIVFLGRMDYFPNVDGVHYFVRDMFPLIRQKLPGVELRIIGSNPAKSVRDLAKIPNVSITGYVQDVRHHLRAAAVSIAPLRIARGMQNKILEALAMGIPTVATPEAAKGVECVPGKHLLVAGCPKTFAEMIIRLIEDGTLRRNLAEAGRRQIEWVYGWDHSLDRLNTILTQRPSLS